LANAKSIRRPETGAVLTDAVGHPVCMEGPVETQTGVAIRTSPRPGDADAVAELHDRLYTAEDGFGPRFTAYVADGMAELVRALEHDPGAGRLWLAEVDGALEGSIAIVRAAPTVAQLRWYLLSPELRGRGLGRHLLDQALAYAASNAYESVFLLTVKGLDRAAKLYRAAGFVLTDERPGAPWAGRAIEQRYELRLSPPASS
jgi:ribosomal protein S18 acetylase RimI-like enzyme